MTRNVAAALACFAALHTASAAKGGITVKVVDRESKPVPSTISFMVNGTWMEVGQTDERGVLSHGKACGSELSIRAEPLDRSYFSPTPRYCTARVVFTVRKRSDPVVAFVQEYDDNNDGRLDRIEFVNFAAATSLWDLQPTGQSFQLALPIRGGQKEDVRFRYLSAYQVVGLASTYADLNPEAANAVASVQRNGLLTALAVDKPTARPDPEWRDALRKYLEAYEVPKGTGSLSDSLERTSTDFTKLDKNSDGFLSLEELTEVKSRE